jgi:hypothetical protein
MDFFGEQAPESFETAMENFPKKRKAPAIAKRNRLLKRPKRPAVGC